MENKYLKGNEALKDAVTQSEKRLAAADRALLPRIEAKVSQLAIKLSAAAAKLELLDPGNPLKRGYSLTMNAEGRIVRSADELAPGDLLLTRLGKGETKSRVEG